MKEAIQKQIEEEGNELEFEAYGLKCLIIRHKNLLHWCGYVQIPKDTRIYRENRSYYYSDSELGLSDFEKSINNLDVHGGITYNGDRKKDGNLYWGFDCGHLGDISPGLEQSYHSDETYKDKEYVIEETTNLARQIKEIIEVYK